MRLAARIGNWAPVYRTDHRASKINRMKSGMIRDSAVRDLRAYKPGQMVPVSGLYSVIHQNHRPRHEALAIRGDEFPSCRVCKSAVRFYVVEVIPYIIHDFDLAGPDLERKSSAKAASS